MHKDTTREGRGYAPNTLQSWITSLEFGAPSFLQFRLFSGLFCPAGTSSGSQGFLRITGGPKLKKRDVSWKPRCKTKEEEANFWFWRTFVAKPP